MMLLMLRLFWGGGIGNWEAHDAADAAAVLGGPSEIGRRMMLLMLLLFWGAAWGTGRPMMLLMLLLFWGRGIGNREAHDAADAAVVLAMMLLMLLLFLGRHRKPGGRQ